MTTQSITQHTENLQPTAEGLAQAQPIVTLETVIVCTGITALLTVVANVVGLAIGLLITALVLRGNAQVRQMSIENAILDRIEREGQR